MAFQNNLIAIPMTSIASTALGGYAALNPLGLPTPCFVLKIVNNSDADVTVSFDGTTDNDFVPKGTSDIMPPLYCNQPNNFSALWKQGQKVFIKGVAGMTGSVYLVGYALQKSTV